MSGKTEGIAGKGSQHWMQRYANEKQQELSRAILSSCASLIAAGATQIDWVSPLKENNYKEHRDDFLDALGLPIAGKLLKEFWPKNGPQWDGLAWVRGKSLDGLLLLEAKGYPDETISASKAEDPDSISRIDQSLEKVQKYMGIPARDWTSPYYQLANRMAFLYFLNIVAQVPSWLILVNFVNDRTHRPTSLEQWLEHYREMLPSLGISEGRPLFSRIGIVFLDAE